MDQGKWVDLLVRQPLAPQSIDVNKPVTVNKNVDTNKRRRIERPEGHFEKAKQELHAAQVLLADRVAEVADGLVHEGRGTFDDVANRWLKSKVRIRPSTRRSYEQLKKG